jgi:nucleotide-binding universal stress UspA family protein
MTRSLRADQRRPPPVIVAALDGSAPSRCITALAAGLIKRMGWRLALVPVPLAATAADRRRRLIAAASDERAALIASPATHHESAAGSAGDLLALAACAPCPVLAVPPAGVTYPALSGPVVCGIDGADESPHIARAAARLAAALGAGLELVHVESGDPAGRLCAIAESERALLVIGAPPHGRAGGEGRLATSILTESHVPVAVVSAGVAVRGLEAIHAAPTLAALAS